MELYTEPINVYRKKQRDAVGRFKPGHTPFNKGTKGFAKKNKTSYKKGHEPYNTKYDGAVSIRKDSKGKRYYKYLRIAKGQWVLLHRYLWEKHYGKIPDKHIIRFIDGNTMNCTIENLECISMNENRKRNLNYKKSAETLKNTWKKERMRESYGLPTKTKLINRKNAANNITK